MQTRVLCWMTIVGLAVAPVWAQFDSGSDGSDGALDCTALIAAYGCPVGCDPCDVEIGLGLAATAMWDTPAPVAGQGVYDADEWAVVFKYTTIDIPAGVTVTFKNHRSGAPVVWLASGSVTVEGTVNLDGEDGVRSSPAFFAEPGPGGFAGGRGFPPGARDAGFGPGGANIRECIRGKGGGYGQRGGSGWGCSEPGGQTYGSLWVSPLIGGSGASGGGASTRGGGAGGGAILIASSDAIALEGAITASGGDGQSNDTSTGGGGSGGAIRLIANAISGAGQLRARGGSAWADSYGGVGRIRVEADSVSLTDPGSPVWTSSTPWAVFPEVDVPMLKVTAVDLVSVPIDPEAGPLTADAEINSESLVTIDIEATNIPAGTTVEVRIVSIDTNSEDGNDAVYVTSTLLQDIGGGLLTATAEATLPFGRSEIQLKANWTP